MFIEQAGANCACEFLVWSLNPTQAGLANTCTVGYLGGVLGAIDPKNQTVCLVTPMFTEPAGANCACGFLVWFLIPTQAGLANTRTVCYLGVIYPKIRHFVF